MRTRHFFIFSGISIDVGDYSVKKSAVSGRYSGHGKMLFLSNQKKNYKTNNNMKNYQNILQSDNPYRQAMVDEDDNHA